MASGGRGFLAALSTASVVGFINVYGDVELNSLDSFWNSLFPKVQRCSSSFELLIKYRGTSVTRKPHPLGPP